MYKTAIRNILNNNYYNNCIFTGNDVYEWAASDVFDLITYDAHISQILVKKIIEVCKHIHNKTVSDYIKDETNYIDYIWVCQILYKLNWINWGTSIRAPWFEYSPDNINIIENLPFTEHGLLELIDFIETIGG